MNSLKLEFKIGNYTIGKFKIVNLDLKKFSQAPSKISTQSPGENSSQDPEEGRRRRLSELVTIDWTEGKY
jgi:hypothetical protein